MGKRLVIKGADFSQNGIESSTLNITSLLEISKGVHGLTGNDDSSVAKYSAIYPRYDLSDYIERGYTTIKIVVVTKAYAFFAETEEGSVSTSGGTAERITGESGYPGPGTYTKSLKPSLPFLGFNMDKTLVDGEQYDNVSDYMLVYLLKDE